MIVKSALVAMSILGCDCDARVCVPLDSPSARWTTQAECEAAGAIAMRRAHVDYPVVRAVCAPATPSGDTGSDAVALAPQQEVRPGTWQRGVGMAAAAGRSVAAGAAALLEALIPAAASIDDDTRPRLFAGLPQ